MSEGGTIAATRVDISILIVNYNVKDYLLQCLHSIQASVSGVTYEIVVVDNCSLDGSLTDLQPMFPRVKFIALEKNIGFGKANNVGLRYCTARYVLFLNPDTIISPETLVVMTRYMDEHAEVGIAGCKVLNPDGSFQLACRRGLPTPWASFCKLFGLQTLFPRSQLFARYNLTYRPIDATYEVDALIGAFMMARTDVLEKQQGFDPAFFMYGEDIDLCYRIQQDGWKVMYVHTTSIIHFKGESTKRSSINEVRVFYDAMEIFARKHFGGSMVFLALLRTGISLRALFARIMRKRVEVITWILDVLSINLALLGATALRFDGPFGFPEYAYPTVPIVVSVVASLSMVAVGEYVEYIPTIRRSTIGLLVTFFVLSSLTYFFKEYAFSRGVLLMTIGFSAVLFALVRWGVGTLDASHGKRSRKILLVGINQHTARIIAELRRAEHRRTEIVGVVATGPFSINYFEGVPIVGDTGYLARILGVTGAQEVVLTDAGVSRGVAMELMIASSAHRARFHMASDYDDIITARIINDVAGIEPTVSIPPLIRFRNRVAKRTADMVLSLAMLTVGLPILILRKSDTSLRDWSEVFSGKRSIVGLFPDNKRRSSGKSGITGLVHISDPRGLSKLTIEHLNDYYVDSYSIALDVEIFLKHIFWRNRG